MNKMLRFSKIITERPYQNLIKHPSEALQS